MIHDDRVQLCPTDDKSVGLKLLVPSSRSFSWFLKIWKWLTFFRYTQRISIQWGRWWYKWHGVILGGIFWIMRWTQRVLTNWYIFWRLTCLPGTAMANPCRIPRRDWKKKSGEMVWVGGAFNMVMWTPMVRNLFSLGHFQSFQKKYHLSDGFVGRSHAAIWRCNGEINKTRLRTYHPHPRV